MSAAHRGETEIVLQLLQKNAKVNEVDTAGWSPLMYSLNCSVPMRGSPGDTGDKKVNIDGVLGRKSTIEIIMLHKADINQRAPDGLRPLIIAASHDRPAAVKWLLDGRAEVNAATERGQNALILAASQDLPDVARALILANADVNAANAKGESPLSLSEKYVHLDVVDLLKKAGAVASKTGKKGKKGKKK
jgi:ankyrin repeat protein